MPASGELAALFARRGIGDDDETDANNNIEKEAIHLDDGGWERLPTKTEISSMEQATMKEKDDMWPTREKRTACWRWSQL